MRTQRAKQALSHYAEYRRLQEVRRDADVEQTVDRRGRVVRMQRREHEMPGQRGLDRHFRRLEVTDLTHHDDIGILPHECAVAAGATDAETMLHLHLIEGR